MKELVLDLGREVSPLRIIPMSDIHLGDPLCDMGRLRDTLNYAKETGSKLILNGDLMNNALKTSKSDSYEASMSIEMQQEALIHMLKPLRENILFMTGGNHEYRTRLSSGIDPLKYVASELGIKDRYDTESYLLTLLFGEYKSDPNVRCRYVIYGTHGGYGGGRRPSSTVNSLENMSRIVTNADLYLHSHTHVHATFSDAIAVYNYNTRRLRQHRRLYFNTSSYVQYGGYAERAEYKMTDLTQYELIIEPTRSRDEVTYQTTIQPIPR